jgi:hypothetical protein
LDGRASPIQQLDKFFVKARPTLFAYQYVMRLTPHAEDRILASSTDQPLDGRSRSGPTAELQ